MSDVIELLEKMGQDAQWSFASQDELQLALAAAEITPEVQAAMVASDQQGLQKLLGIAPLYAMLSPGENEEHDHKDHDEELPGHGDEDSASLISNAAQSDS